MKKAVVSRLVERRYSTLDPKEMLNMYIAERVDKKWTEDFVDADTGQTVSVERHSVLYAKGTLINQDVLAKIRFDIESGELKTPILVSNQNREAFEYKNTHLQPWSAKAEIEGKNVKFLVYASGVDNAMVILRDYIELNYKGGFVVTQLGEFTDCVILEDSLSDKMDEHDIDLAYLRDEIDMETYVKATQNKTTENAPKNSPKKYYQMDLTVTATDSDGENKHTETFVVHTFDTERAMIVVKAYLKMRDQERADQAAKDGRAYEKKNFSLLIEKAAPIPVGCFIPLDFSLVYAEEQ